MLSNKLKIRELVGSYWTEPLFFYIERNYTDWQWLAFDNSGIRWYFYSVQRNGKYPQEYWGLDLRNGRARILGKNYTAYARILSDNVWNFWLDAIFDPEGRGELKPNAQ